MRTDRPTIDAYILLGTRIDRSTELPTFAACVLMNAMLHISDLHHLVPMRMATLEKTRN